MVMASSAVVAIHSTAFSSLKPEPRGFSSSGSIGPLPRRQWRQRHFPALLTSPALPKVERSNSMCSPCCCTPTAAPPVTPLADLYEFICKGPLLHKAGHDSESVKGNMDEWLELGLRLSRQLGFNELFLSPSEKVRIYHYYVPVFLWCKQQLADHQAKFKDGDEVPALVIGITAPQGCGKSTLVYSLDYLFNATGKRAVSVSIDDFYLTGKEQDALAAENPDNSLLELRGNAGSHDLKLGTDTLQSLRNLSSPGKKTTVPRYDKSARSGRGDRLDESLWTLVEGPLKVVLFEGWMLGFQPVDPSVYEPVDPQLSTVNKNLAAYHEAWDSYVDSWIVIKVSKLEAIYNWRLQAEIGMRATGRPGMTDEQVRDFVSRYMPAYKAYLPELYRSGPKGSVPEKTFMFDIDENRNPIC